MEFITVIPVSFGDIEWMRLSFFAIATTYIIIVVSIIHQTAWHGIPLKEIARDWISHAAACGLSFVFGKNIYLLNFARANSFWRKPTFRQLLCNNIVNA